MSKVRLPLPKLLDLSNDQSKIGNILIENTQHAFSTDSKNSGSDVKYKPIFGSKVYLDHELVSHSTFGLPFIRVKRGTKPHIKIQNKTKYTFDIHWHGLNTTADVDGASTQLEFGEDTAIGKTLDINFPTINNNSGLLWYHAHPMFRSSPFVYTGLYGILNIVDEESKHALDSFVYGDNHLILVYQDIDLNEDGIYTYSNLYTDEARSNSPST